MLIMRLFRGETEPSKHLFWPSRQIRRTFAVTKRDHVDLSVSVRM